MKQLAGLSALALIIGTSSGCGWIWGDNGYFRDRGSDYLAARETAPMQLPPDVQARRIEPLLPVPASVATRSAEGEFEVPRPQGLQATAQRSDFSLQRSGERRWVVAQRSPAEVWPLARQFFEENGLSISEERPETGELVSAWQTVPTALARHLDKADAEVSVRLRVEPGVQRNTSEIFLLSNVRPAGSSAEPAWPARSVQPALDGALIERLQSSLSSSVGQGGSVSLLADRSFDAPKRVSLGSDGSGNPQLSLATDFDRAWSAVGRALQDGDVRVDDMNRSLGIYYINLAESADKPGEEPGFFAGLLGGKADAEDVESRAERYHVRLTTVGDSVQVSVEKDLETVAPADVARRVLELIQEHLG
ncbi:MAG TPA: outer membrane protein assembly factor BamC [Pseudomonas sp.]